MSDNERHEKKLSVYEARDEVFQHFCGLRSELQEQISLSGKKTRVP